MDQITRIKIGLFFYHGQNWMGGMIYIINLIKSLDMLSDHEKPEIILFYNDNSKAYLHEIIYPYLKTVYKPQKNNLSNYLNSILRGKNCFEDGVIDHYQLDGLFPLNDFPIKLGKNNSKAAAWYPDLQHKFYPQYFSKLRIFLRELRIKQIVKNASHVVCSSYDVYHQFQKFYRLKSTTRFHILHFTSILDGIYFPSIVELKMKYQLKDEYFMVSNQFFQHKNHQIVFKAIKHLKDNNIICKVLFTGKMEDDLNPEFIEGLKQLINDFDIQNYMEFAGLIGRGEQLCLMKNSLAVIQPSLFEGWSTVIEDAKALKCQIIASNLEVHKEQLDNGLLGFLFEPDNEKELGNLMKGFLKKDLILKPTVDNYKTLSIDFARRFMNIFFQDTAKL